MTHKRKAVALALVNSKGGVGKTTTAVNVAAAMAAEGRRVLLVDLDAQGSAGLSLGLSRSAPVAGTAAVVLEGLPVRDAVCPSAAEGLDVLPGNMALASADLLLADMDGREAVVKTALAPVLADYDVVVLDCPPSLGLLTVNALVAADFFLVPLTLDYLALEGLSNLLAAVDRIRTGIGKVADLAGIVLVMADYRQRVTSELESMVRRHFGKAVLRTVVRVNVRVKEAPSFGLTIFDYDRRSAGAEAYRLLTREVTRRIMPE